ncbi:2-keto-4-pentenoate hydratase [Pandoraea terrae]|uniref:2-keto-4-pentenoate hydratase n=1 Tax=Pandoraea terrae TaxID=1537710 RepID=A0A5E4TGF9_9BURK|nr:2-keto-4-pentenoate hydratase [Pandoraea terrae]VVD86581.1 2-keto-4-pentenoate hydratase [Pandoraea terrae]
MNVSETDMLSRKLAHARSAITRIDTLADGLVPVNDMAAYVVQREICRFSNVAIGGWKVGRVGNTEDVQGGVLPSEGIHPSGVQLRANHFPPLGLELEIAFRFGRAFEPRDAAYTDDEVLSSIAEMAPTIEIVASRFAQWPDIDRRAQLADLYNHGALVVGDYVPYREDFPFVTPIMRLEFDGKDVLEAAPTHPAGDPRTLLTWIVNHCTQFHRIALTPEMPVTTGSYTGMYFPGGMGMATATIDGIGPVAVTLD